MTSKSFCSKEEFGMLRTMIKEKLRRSLWAISLCALAFFFMLTIPSIMGVQRGMEMRETDPMWMESVDFMLKSVVGRDNVFITLATVSMAVLLATVSFRYMHSKKQVDFYHSLPIRRTWLFAANFLAGLFSFLAAYLLNLVLALGIICCTGFGYVLKGAQVPGTVALHLVFFLVLYALTVLAHQLAGTTATGLLCTGFCMAVFPAALGLFVLYGELLYIHWFFPDGLFNQIGQCISPVWSYFTMAFTHDAPLRGGMMLYWLVWALVLGGLGMLLYARRPSESAGRAVAFSRPASVFKYTAVVLCALGGGAFFRAIGSGFGWQLFGFACGGILSHCVLEVIYNLDFKKVFCHIKGLAVCGVCFAAVYTVFHLDLLGYDKFQPEPGRVKAVSLMGTENENHVLGEESGEMDVLKRQTYRQPENIQTALELCEFANGWNNEENEWGGARIWVCYQMNSGRKAYRSYALPTEEEFLEKWAALYDSREYKENYYPIYQLADSELQSVGCWQGYVGYTGFVRQPEQAVQLAQVLREETLSLTAQGVKNQAPVAMLEWSDDPEYQKDRNYSQMLTKMPVYPSMEKTLALMEEYDLYEPGPVLALDEIQGVWLWNWNGKDDTPLELADGVMVANTQQSGDVYITDKAAIAQLLEKAVIADMAEQNCFFRQDAVQARFVLDENLDYSVDCFFPEGEFPLPKK